MFWANVLNAKLHSTCRHNLGNRLPKISKIEDTDDFFWLSYRAS